MCVPEVSAFSFSLVCGRARACVEGFCHMTPPSHPSHTHTRRWHANVRWPRTIGTLEDRRFGDQLQFDDMPRHPPFFPPTFVCWRGSGRKRVDRTLTQHRTWWLDLPVPFRVPQDSATTLKQHNQTGLRSVDKGVQLDSTRWCAARFLRPREVSLRQIAGRGVARAVLAQGYAV